MFSPDEAAATTQNTAAESTEKPAESLLDTAGKETQPKAEAGKEAASLLDQAGEEEKAAQAAEEKRLLEAKDEDLSDEDKTKKAALIKAQEEAKVKAEAEAKAKAVPEKYEFKVPEGFTLNEALVNEVTPLFKDLKLNQEQAQKFVDVYSKVVAKQQETHAQEFNKFLEESKKETIEALGANYQKELSYAAKVRDTFFSKETREFLNASGISNQKSFLLDLINLGKKISEDTLTAGRSAAQEVDALSVMYPSMKK